MYTQLYMYIVYSLSCSIHCFSCRRRSSLAESGQQARKRVHPRRSPVPHQDQYLLPPLLFLFALPGPTRIDSCEGHNKMYLHVSHHRLGVIQSICPIEGPTRDCNLLREHRGNETQSTSQSPGPVTHHIHRQLHFLVIFLVFFVAVLQIDRRWFGGVR